MDLKRMRKLDLAWDVYEEFLSDSGDNAFSHGLPVDFPTWLHRQYKIARCNGYEKEGDRNAKKAQADS